MPSRVLVSAPMSGNDPAMKEDESMPRITKSIDIGAPVEKVFAYLSDSRNSPEWFVGMTEVTDVSGSGVGQHNRWTYTMIGIPFHGDSKLTEA